MVVKNEEGQAYYILLIKSQAVSGHMSLAYTFHSYFFRVSSLPIDETKIPRCCRRVRNECPFPIALEQGSATMFTSEIRRFGMRKTSPTPLLIQKRNIPAKKDYLLIWPQIIIKV